MLEISCTLHSFSIRCKAITPLFLFLFLTRTFEQL
jgi:hypothetical protein